MLLKFIKTVNIIISCFYLLSCTLGSNGDYSVTNIPDIKPCELNNDGNPTVKPCTLQSSADQTFYAYTQKNGGRNDMLAVLLSPIMLLNESLNTYELKADLPTGWNDGNTQLNVNLPPEYVAENIAKDVNFLGLIGTMIVSKTICSVNPVTDKCWTAADTTGKYVYTTPYNGRGLDCKVDGGVPETASCFINSKGFNKSGLIYLLNASALPVNCSSYRNPTTGQIGLTGTPVECQVPVNNYYYLEQNGGGGRNKDCDPAAATYSTACWFNPGATPVQMSLNGSSSSNNACVIDTGVANTTACQILAAPPLPPKYVYTQPYGARLTLNAQKKEVFCSVDDNKSPCFYNQSNKSSYIGKKGTAVGLTADKIKVNVSVFGIVGSYYADGEWASGLSRTLNTSRMDLSVESQTHAGSAADPNLPDNYHEVPLFYLPNDLSFPQVDDDGSGIQAVDRSLWGSTTCGLTGTLAQRISDCGLKVNGAAWDGISKGNAAQGKWTLISRSGVGKEVWRDESTGMLWSSLVANSLNWCKATGSNNSGNSSVAAGLKEVDPDNICSNSIYQSTSAGASVVSACHEGAGFTTTDSKILNTGKSNLNLASSPSVHWRIPTLYDYQIAEYHGMRFVLPDSGSARAPNQPLLEWTGTINSLSTVSEEAWSIDSKEWDQINTSRTAELGVRCIGN